MVSMLYGFFQAVRVVNVVFVSFYLLTGAESIIAKMRNQLKSLLETERERYFTTNGLRNPFKDAELYILPMGVAAAAWIAAVLVNATCSTDFCEHTEDTFVNIYLFVLFGVIVLAWQHIKGVLGYVREVLPVLLNGAGAPGAGDAARDIMDSLAGAAAKAGGVAAAGSKQKQQ
jgi:hypothetical protein